VDLQTLCIVIILTAMVMMLMRALLAAGKTRKRPKRVAPPPGAFALDPSGLRFYIAYLVGVAREIARMNKIAYGPALETPIRMEMIRLGITGSSGGDVMARILASDEGQQGLIAGEMDGADACDPDYSGGYFTRILSYFTDAQVRGPR
jgi:hypothetical protein